MAQKFYRKKTPIKAQEGDFPAPIVITVPDLLPLDGYLVTFQVKNPSGRIFISKKSETGSITVQGQIIQIDFEKADTLNHPGTHEWELELRKADSEEITIGGGMFTIEPTSIK